MKTTFKFIIAAMAASAVLTSCQKEMAIDNTASSTDGVRVISASFSAPTKSTLDGKTPKFVGGETVKVSNATASEECTISVNGGVATFSTTLSGTLTAVYPSTAAKMNGDVIDNSAVLVSTVQDGTFASANIAMATGITASATFTNKTAVIKITPGAGANTKYVEVITAGPEIANDVPTGSAFTKLNKIHVNTTSADSVYVSILVPSGLKVQNLSFADGSNIKTAKDNTTAIAINTISTVNNTLWNTPYVEINGLKWATMNIGATSETEFGQYFAWGEVVGHKRAGTGESAFTSDFDSFDHSDSRYTGTWNASSGFAYCNSPYYDNNYVFSKYKDNSSATLELSDDAANANWGGSWRMPTSAEFQALYDACLDGSYKKTTKPSGASASVGKGVYWCPSYDGVAGCLFCDGSNKLFFPAAGYGDGTGLTSPGVCGYYRSSSLYTDYPYSAYCLYFDDIFAEALGDIRYGGMSVRALSE